MHPETLMCKVKLRPDWCRHQHAFAESHFKVDERPWHSLQQRWLASDGSASIRDVLTREWAALPFACPSQSVLPKPAAVETRWTLFDGGAGLAAAEQREKRAWAQMLSRLERSGCHELMRNNSECTEHVCDLQRKVDAVRALPRRPQHLMSCALRHADEACAKAVLAAAATTFECCLGKVPWYIADDLRRVGSKDLGVVQPRQGDNWEQKFERTWSARNGRKSLKDAVAVAKALTAAEAELALAEEELAAHEVANKELYAASLAAFAAKWGVATANVAEHVSKGRLGSAVNDAINDAFPIAAAQHVTEDPPSALSPEEEEEALHMEIDALYESSTLLSYERNAVA